MIGWQRIGCIVGAVAAFGSVGGVGAYPQPQAQSTLAYLVMDAAAPHPAVSFPESREFWAGPTGSTVWVLTSPNTDQLVFALPTTKPVPDPVPVPQPGPAWQPVTVWGWRGAEGTRFSLVGAPGTWWGAPAAGLNTQWDSATGRLTLTRP